MDVQNINIISVISMLIFSQIYMSIIFAMLMINNINNLIMIVYYTSYLFTVLSLNSDISFMFSDKNIKLIADSYIHMAKNFKF